MYLASRCGGAAEGACSRGSICLIPYMAPCIYRKGARPNSSWWGRKGERRRAGKSSFHLAPVIQGRIKQNLLKKKKKEAPV